MKPFPNGARIAVIIRDDDTCALTPPEYLQTVYEQAWTRNFPVSLAVVPAIMGSHNLNIPPGLRGSGEVYSLEEKSELVKFLREKQKKGQVDVMLHGYHHTTNLELQYPPFGARTGYSRELLSQSSEFWGLEKSEVLKRLQAGKQELESLFGPVTSFVAPQEYLTPGLWEALAEVGIKTYSGGIRPTVWKQLPWRAIHSGALLKLAGATLTRTPLPLLGDYVSLLTATPIIPATQRVYWSQCETREAAQQLVTEAMSWFKKKYEKGGGTFLILTHYWEYFGDWQKQVTQKEQLWALNELLAKIDTYDQVWKCTLSEYGKWLRSQRS